MKVELWRNGSKCFDIIDGSYHRKNLAAISAMDVYVFDLPRGHGLDHSKLTREEHFELKIYDGSEVITKKIHSVDYAHPSNSTVTVMHAI